MSLSNFSNVVVSNEDMKQKITGRTKAVIPVHFGGHPACMEEIYDVARKHDLLVIEDAAEAMGSFYYDKPCGTLADIGVLSIDLFFI